MMTSKYNSVPISLLRELLCYNPETGKMTWLPRKAHHMSCSIQTNEHAMKRWNSRYAGTPALSAIHNVYGYMCGGIFKQKFRLARVAFAIYYNRWPKEEIDHIDHNKQNNRIKNLREVTAAVNSKNKPMKKNSTIHVFGVSKFRNKFRARITVSQKEIHLGVFDNIENAISVRKQAEIKYGFHENHGKELPTP